MSEELLVIIQIAGRRCALPALAVRSVIELAAIAPIPRAPAHITGIAALRSQALTVIDCRRALGLAAEEWPTDHRAVVVAQDGHAYALRVDGIEDITSAIGAPGQVPGGFGAEWSRAARGMIETQIGPALLLDPAALIAGSDLARSESEAAA